MTPRELYFRTHHQAAHAVTAMTLGCQVDSVGPTGEIVWSLERASLDDLAAICAAGFEMERILGRMYEQAWARSADDRMLMGVLCADRTGIDLSESEIDERFLAGAKVSRDILEHRATRTTIEDLAAKLADLYDAGTVNLATRDIFTPDKLDELYRPPVSN